MFEPTSRHSVLFNEEDSLVEPYVFKGSPTIERLDKALAKLLPEHSRSRLQGWIVAGFVQINGAVAKVKQLVGPEDILTVWPQPSDETLAFNPQPVPFNVIAASPDWIVVEKPAGLVIHPGAGNWQGTLLNGLLYRYPELVKVARAGIVHRLDKDTSGLLVVARHERAQTHLVRQLQARCVKRKYIALIHGWLEQPATVDRPIGRDARVPTKMSVQRPIAPKQAITHYVPQRQGWADEQQVTEIVCYLETGRTHQIRVHLASLGHALIADTLYGGKSLVGAQRQMLHAHALQFDDPGGTGNKMFICDLPEDINQVMRAIKWQT